MQGLNPARDIENMHTVAVAGEVTFPTSLPLSEDVRDLLLKVLRPNPKLRIYMPEIEVRRSFPSSASCPIRC